MATSTVIPDDIKTLKGDVSKAKEDISSINVKVSTLQWICPYISRHLLSLNPLLACCRRYSRGER